MGFVFRFLVWNVFLESLRSLWFVLYYVFVFGYLKDFLMFRRLLVEGVGVCLGWNGKWYKFNCIYNFIFF